MFSSKTLIKHYTPPTCTLEIYGNDSFFSFNKYNQIPEKFNFELHFDDPRFPDEKRGIIKGDRHKLELLGEVVNNYVNQFMHQEKASFPYCSSVKGDKSEQNDIYIINEGLLNQELYYFSRDKDNLEITIKLTTLQLFDLANTLDKYKLDVNNLQQNSITPQKKLTLFSLITIFLVGIIGGGIWWRDRLFLYKNNQQFISIDSEKLKTTIQDVIPPNSLDPSTIPSVPSLQLPPELQNRQKLPPPPATLNQPPIQQTNISSNNQLPPPKSIPNNNNSITNNKNNKPIETVVIPPPPEAPSSVNTSPSQSTPTFPNVIAINPNPKSLTSNNEISSNSSNNNKQPNSPITKVPVLQSSSSFLPPANTDGGLSNSVSVLPQNIKKIPSPLNSNSFVEKSQKTNSLKNIGIQTEIKQYFQKKWQPPENLTQSIEYRLIINNDGSLQRVTPIGQTSVIFLDRSGIPLMGEAIASSFTESKQATIRLIMSPNGNVETFLE